MILSNAVKEEQWSKKGQIDGGDGGEAETHHSEWKEGRKYWLLQTD